MNWKTYFALKDRSKRMFWVSLFLILALHLLFFKPLFGGVAQEYCMQTSELCVLQDVTLENGTPQDENTEQATERHLLPEERYWFSCGMHCEAAPAPAIWKLWLDRALYGPLFPLLDIFIAYLFGFLAFRYLVHKQEKKEEGSGEDTEDSKGEKQEAPKK